MSESQNYLQRIEDVPNHGTNSLAVLAAHIAGTERLWITKVVKTQPFSSATCKARTSWHLAIAASSRPSGTSACPDHSPKDHNPKSSGSDAALVTLRSVGHSIPRHKEVDTR